MNRLRCGGRNGNVVKVLTEVAQVGLPGSQPRRRKGKRLRCERASRCVERFVPRFARERAGQRRDGDCFIQNPARRPIQGAHAFVAVAVIPNVGIPELLFLLNREALTSDVECVGQRGGRIALLAVIQGRGRLDGKIAERWLTHVRAYLAQLRVVSRAQADDTRFSQGVSVRDVENAAHAALRVVGGAIRQLNGLHFSNGDVDVHRLRVRFAGRHARGLTGISSRVMSTMENAPVS